MVLAHVRHACPADLHEANHGCSKEPPFALLLENEVWRGGRSTQPGAYLPYEIIANARLLGHQG